MEVSRKPEQSAETARKPALGLSSAAWRAQTMKSIAVANYRLETLRPFGSYRHLFVFFNLNDHILTVRNEVDALNKCVARLL